MKCRIKDITINYEIIGEGKPIVMIHGYYADHTLLTGCMEPIFQDIKGFKRIYIDLPGMGDSESAEWIMSSDDMLSVVTEFISQIVPDENFLVAGNSYGGYLARGVLYKMQDRVDGIALICPIAVMDYSKRNLPEHSVVKRDESLLSKLSKDEAEDFDASMVIQNEKIYERYKNEIMSGVYKADSDFLQNIMKNGYEFSFNVDKLQIKFEKPSVILLGKQDDCVGYKDQWDLFDNFPRAVYAVIDGAGHNLQIEQEKLFTTLISDWMTRTNMESATR